MTRETQQGGVLILAVEEHERDVKARLKRFGMTEADPIYIHADKLHSSPEVLRDIRAFIVKHEIILVIIDSLSRFWNVQDENDNMEIMREVSPLLDMAHETNAAILPIHHERKSGGEDGVSMRGGSSLFGLADQAIFLVLPQGKRTNRRILKTLGRHEDSPPELMIELVNDDYVVLGTPEDCRNSTKIKATLTDQPQDKAAIAEKAGITENVAGNVLKALTEQGGAVRSGSGTRGDPYVYSLFSISPLLKKGISGE